MADSKFEAINRDHRQFWDSFVRFSTYATASIVVLLVLMAFFLIR